MEYPRQNPTPISGGVIAALIFIGFLTVLLVGLGVTSVVHDPERASTAPSAATVPAPTATPAPAPAPATEFPDVKTPDVPTRSQQPNEAVDTAPATPPSSEPASPSPNVPAPAP